MAEELFSLNIGTYNYPESQFGAIKIGVTGNKHPFWYHCREEFLQCELMDEFLFYEPGREAVKRLENSCQMLEKIQDKLGLKNRLNIRKTTCANCLLYELGSFWKPVWRRDLLTAFIRAGRGEFKTLEEMVKNGRYLKRTVYATTRFLDGYTTYTGWKYTGWVKEFKHRELEARVDQIDKLLVKEEVPNCPLVM